jgi:glycosyltransferase involved in cell wall biosynthesis
MSAAPLVSVVTPVYNGEPYLRECVESVLAQTWTNFEYLVFDNCSTDSTVAIAREYASRDTRIRVITSDEFVSADANANRALKAIDPAARYVKVLHGDDWLFPACLEKMVSLAEAHPRVGLVSAYRRVGDYVGLTGLSTDVTVLRGEAVGQSALLGGPLPYLLGSPSSLLVRADLVRARPEFYNLDNPHQSDQEACLDLLRESDLGFVHEVLTFTRRHDAAESPYYVRIGAQAPCSLRLLLEYGSSYLSEEERQRKLAVRLAEYALYVVRHPLRLVDGEFRAYHATELRALAPRIRLRDVAAGTVRQLMGLGRRSQPAAASQPSSLR